MSVFSDRLAMVQAAVACSLSAHEKLGYAGVLHADSIRDQYLALLGPGAFGYFIDDELFVLENNMKNLNAERSLDTDSDKGRKLTNIDMEIDKLTSRLHNQILNPNIPFKLQMLDPMSLQSIDKVFGDALNTSEFAKPRKVDNEKLKKARDLLFEVDDSGDKVATKMLLKYREFEERIFDARLSLVEFKSQNDQVSIDAAEVKINHLKAEWIIVGNQVEVENAFSIISKITRDASFEDERNIWREQFKSGAVKRISAIGQTYHIANLTPISPLFSVNNDPHWRKISLTAKDVRKIVDDSIMQLFDTDTHQIISNSESLKSISFEYYKCSIHRDWLDTDFLNARFWRFLDDKQLLSDGVGNGALSTIPSSAIFIRNVNATFEKVVVINKNNIRPLKNIIFMRAQANNKIITVDQKNKIINEKGLTLSHKMNLKRNALEKSRVDRNLSFKKKTISNNKTLPVNMFFALPGTAIASRRVNIRENQQAKLIKRSLLIFSGKIHLPKGMSKNVDYSLTITTNKPTKEIEQSVALNQLNDGSLSFLHKTKSLTSVFLIKLKDSIGNVIHSEIINSNKKILKENRTWTLGKVITDEIIYTDAIASHLYGYAVDLVPQCPNPDDSLIWAD